MATDLNRTSETIQQFQRYVVPNYTRFPVCLVKGEGCRVWDSDGNEYLDLFPGWGCNLLGHCPPAVVQAVKHQLETLIHVPNTWYIEPQGRWAEWLAEKSFGGQAFFCNSGAEANEAAIKLARLHSGPQRYKIITFQGGFHGRTLATTTATAQPKYHEGLGPLVAGFAYAPFGDLEAVEQLVDEQTCAVLVEPIQGEGGVQLPPDGFLEGLRQLADRRELLLIFDEVQTGCGRTGRWFAYQHSDVQPDIMTLAKGLCGGLAGAAMLATAEVAKSLRPGMHASTFGGNPIAARAGVATLETIEREGLVAHAQAMGERFRRHLEALRTECPLVRDVRIRGLMIGLELAAPGAPVVQQCIDRRLLINCTQQTVLRLLPAMNVRPEEVDQGCRILSDILRQYHP